MAASLANTPQFRMADRMVEGRLTSMIADLRADGMSFEGIARHLYAEHGIQVTGQTLRRWARILGINGVNKAAS